jgi:iron complex outermembrane receptor protein
LPSSKNKRAALFSFQQYTMGKQALRFSGRVEKFDIDKVASDPFGASDSRNFVGLNGSIGHCYDFSKTNTFETSYSYTERAPSAQELFSNGEHVATGTFELGDTGLRKEKAHAVEVTYKNHTENNQFMTSVYTQKFDDYIALIPTGAQVGGVDEYNYEQVGAIFYGLDIDNRYELKKTEKGSLYLLNKFDFVRAKNTSGGDNLPRISPPRALAGIEYVSDVWRADVETQYVAHQTKIASEETRTNAFWMTNIGYSYNILRNVSSLELFARVRNILNVEARSHISTLKQVAPLPGRNFIAGLQYQF